VREQCPSDMRSEQFSLYRPPLAGLLVFSPSHRLESDAFRVTIFCCFLVFWFCPSVLWSGGFFGTHVCLLFCSQFRCSEPLSSLLAWSSCLLRFSDFPYWSAGYFAREVVLGLTSPCARDALMISSFYALIIPFFFPDVFGCALPHAKERNPFLVDIGRTSGLGLSLDFS